MKYISLEVECAKYLLCEKNYTGQQLESITELKTKNYEEKSTVDLPKQNN
jgi:hypothetical protein